MRFPWTKRSEALTPTPDPIRLAIKNARDAKGQELWDKKRAHTAEWDKRVDPILQTVPELILASDGKNFFIKGLPQEEFYCISSSTTRAYIRDESLVSHLSCRLRQLGMASEATIIDNQFALRVFI